MALLDLLGALPGPGGPGGPGGNPGNPGPGGPGRPGPGRDSSHSTSWSKSRGHKSHGKGREHGKKDC